MKITSRRLGAAFFVLLIPVTVPGCAGYAKSGVERGDAYYKDRKFRDAVAEYTRAIRVNPNHPRAIRQLGLAYAQLGDAPQAFGFLERAREIDPNDTEVRLTLGSLYLGDLRRDAAVKEAEAVLAKWPADLGALNLLGGAMMSKGLVDSAVIVFRRAAELAPKQPRLRYMVATGLLARGKNAEAARELSEALMVAPLFTDALDKLVQMDLAENRSDAALERIRKQIAIAGDSATFHTLLGAVHIRRGESQLAESEFQRAAALDPKFSDAHSRLGALYRSQGKLDEALASGQRALQLDSTNVEARMVMALVSQQRGDVAEAIRQYRAALAVRPSFAAAANNLAGLLADRTPQQALEVALVAQKSDPTNPYISDTMGWILYKLGDNVRAKALLQDAAARLPDSPDVQYHLGMAAQKAGDLTTARDAFKRAVSAKASAPEKELARNALASMK